MSPPPPPQYIIQLREAFRTAWQPTFRDDAVIYSVCVKGQTALFLHTLCQRTATSNPAVLTLISWSCLLDMHLLFVRGDSYRYLEENPEEE
jgi:hypothetical protein